MQVAFRRSNYKARSHPPFETEQYSDQLAHLYLYTQLRRRTWSRFHSGAQEQYKNSLSSIAVEFFYQDWPCLYVLMVRGRGEEDEWRSSIKDDICFWASFYTYSRGGIWWVNVKELVSGSFILLILMNEIGGGGGGICLVAFRWLYKNPGKACVKLYGATFPADSGFSLRTFNT